MMSPSKVLPLMIMLSLFASSQCTSAKDSCIGMDAACGNLSSFVGFLTPQKKPRFLIAGLANAYEVVTVNEVSGLSVSIGNVTAAGFSDAVADRYGENVFVLRDLGSTELVTYKVAADGTLNEITSSVVSSSSAGKIALNPQESAVYSSDTGSANLHVMKFGQHHSVGGQYTYINPNSNEPRKLLADPLNQFLYAGTATPNAVDVYKVTDTIIQPADSQTPTNQFISPFPAVTPSGAFLYVITDTPASTGLISPYIINRSSGALTPLDTFSYGSQIGGAVISSDGRFLFTVDLNGLMLSIELNPDTGVCERIANQVSISPAGAIDDMQITQDGRFIFALDGNGQRITMVEHLGQGRMTLVNEVNLSAAVNGFTQIYEPTF